MGFGISRAVAGIRAIALLLVPGLVSQVTTADAFSQVDRPLRLHPVFSDHMVLQRDAEIRAWGWAAPGTEVAVTLGEQGATARAGAAGRWEATIAPLPAGGPHTLTATAGEQAVEFTDILVGDVWLAAGQSNMEWPVAWSAGATDEIATADWPEIRLLKLPHQAAPCPRDSVVSPGWRVCSPDSVAMFSAAAYSMARDLHQALDVPIGVIDTSWGGSALEAWCRLDLMEGDPLFQEEVARHDTWAEEWSHLCNEQAFQSTLALWRVQTDAEGNHTDPGLQPEATHWRSPEVSDESWETIPLPARWEQHGYPITDGVFWFRRAVEIPTEWRGRDLRLSLGGIDDGDITFFNGVEVGRTGPFPNSWTEPRDYLVPAAITDSETPLIAVRVFDGGGAGGFNGPAEVMLLRPEGGGDPPLPLSGDWRFRPETPMQGNPLVVGEQPHHTAAALYNSMIHPLARLPLRGIAWCQGESNVARHATHRELLSRMIRDWRQHFDRIDLPFLVVQIASFDADWPGWPEVQWAQAEVARDLPNVGLIVTADIGDQHDIHPRNKAEVGRRLALAAREIAHGEAIQGHGPSAVAAHRRDDHVVIEFDNAAEGLIADGMSAEDLQGFEALDAAGEWRPIPGRLEGGQVILSTGSLEPRAIRYHWDDWPIGHLRTGAGSPLSVFQLPISEPRPTD